jgi:hypothetical protein
MQGVDHAMWLAAPAAQLNSEPCPAGELARGEDHRPIRVLQFFNRRDTRG